MINYKAVFLTLMFIPIALTGLFVGCIKAILFMPSDTYDMVLDMLDGKSPDDQDHPFNK